jgi:hypothetical protein
LEVIRGLQATDKTEAPRRVDRAFELIYGEAFDLEAWKKTGKKIL